MWWRTELWPSGPVWSECEAEICLKVGLSPAYSTFSSCIRWDEFWHDIWPACEWDVTCCLLMSSPLAFPPVGTHLKNTETQRHVVHVHVHKDDGDIFLKRTKKWVHQQGFSPMLTLAYNPFDVSFLLQSYNFNVQGNPVDFCRSSSMSTVDMLRLKLSDVHTWDHCCWTHLHDNPWNGKDSMFRIVQ